jgi:radical SAM protein with 4Fe4S-binding SPASM domain
MASYSKLSNNPEMYNNNQLPSSISTLAIMITNNCNQSCYHCFRDNGYTESFFELQVIKKLILLYKKSSIRHIRLTGGEPLLHPNLEDIIIFCNENDIETSIITNGTICTRNKIRLLKDLKLSSLGFSVHSYNFKTHEKLTNNKGSFEILQSAIADSITFGIKTNIYYPVSTYNYHEIEKTLTWLSGLGVNQISILRISPLGKASFNKFKHLNQYEWDQIIDFIYEFSGKLNIPIKVQGISNVNRDVGNCTVSPLKFLNINYRGDIYPCCLLMNDPIYKIGSIEDLFRNGWNKTLIEMQNNIENKNVYKNNLFPCFHKSTLGLKICPIFTKMIGNDEKILAI